MKQSPLRHLEGELAELDAANLRRRRPAPQPFDATSFCSNDYLGLAAISVETSGNPGAAASRLIVGERAEHAALERALSEWLGTESALVFTSGYAANVGLLSALAGRDDLIVSDERNHASIIDGARLSRAHVEIVPHLDTVAVEQALSRHSSGRRWVVTEGYFSMDADSPNFRTLRAICDTHDAALIVDEAHSVGVLGPDGRGVTAEQGVTPDALVGTFGKALGAGGAFVVGSAVLVDWLWNRARSFVFSTGLSPLVAQCALRGVRTAQARPELRARTAQVAQTLRAELTALGKPAAGYGQYFAGHFWDAKLGDGRDEPVGGARGPGSSDSPADRCFGNKPPSHRGFGASWRARCRDCACRVPQRFRRTLIRLNVGRLLLVCGTGTGIGKTHLSATLLRRAGRDCDAAGFKPIESGCTLWDPSSDHAQLAAASVFHVKHAPEYCLSAPVSPHLAARQEGTRIEVARIVERTIQISKQHDILLVETAGGLFSPLNESALNVDLVRALQNAQPEAVTILVASNRLGVLHDVGAVARAAGCRVKLDGIVLSAAAEDDLASETNAAELHVVSSIRLLGTMPRLSVDELLDDPQIGCIYSLLLYILVCLLLADSAVRRARRAVCRA